jgi:membrane peptidoglycan carboxypeptidase
MDSEDMAAAAPGSRADGVDLSEAYAAVRRRARALRRRRILSGLLAAAVLAVVLAVNGYYYVESVPPPDAVGLPETTTVYYADGTTVMARLGERVRVPVDVAALPEYVRTSVVAAEDPRFWTDSGARLSWQYARAAMNIDVSTVSGKARALIMAWKLEDNHPKQEILGFYLNTVYFGRSAYGIEAAAHAYFGLGAARLSLAQAVTLAGVLRSPGDGRYDPTVDATAAARRFAEVAAEMVTLGSLDRSTAAGLRVPPVRAFDPATLQSGLDEPTGLVVSHVLAELRQTPEFRDKPAGYLENGGFTIVTTINARAQDVLERTVDETVPGSVMYRQPSNLQAAAAVVEPGTGRVLAYYGGHDGTGADYAGWYTDAGGAAVGYGAHPPGQTVDVYTLAAAVKAGISVRSRWDSPPQKTYPASGRPAGDPVVDLGTAPCQPTCTLAQATTGGLSVPMFAVAERVGAAAVIDMARAAGVDAMWIPDTPTSPRRRVDVRGQTGAALTPRPFGPDVALGLYPVTVLDQADAMATLAAGGRRADAHFVRRVSRAGQTLVSERLPAGGAGRQLTPRQLDDVRWVLSQNPAGQLPDGRASASQTGTVPLRTSAVETSHAWIVGFTGNLGMAVWVGNVEIELPLHNREGGRVTGAGLPAQVYRTFLSDASDELGLPRIEFPAPAFTGADTAGNVKS